MSYVDFLLLKLLVLGLLAFFLSFFYTLITGWPITDHARQKEIARQKAAQALRQMYPESGSNTDSAQAPHPEQSHPPALPDRS
jgi:hypothetical protein